MGTVTVGSGGEPPDKSLADAYRLIGTVNAAVRRRAADCTGVALKLYRRTSQNELSELPPDNEIDRLFSRPNPREGQLSFWSQFWQSMPINGEAFVLLDRGLSGTTSSGQVTGPVKNLWFMRADRMDLTPGVGRSVKKWTYTDPDTGQLIDFAPEEIWQARYPNPVDTWRGLSPLIAAKPYAELESWTSEHWKRFYKGGARPSMTITTDTGLDPEQKAAWMLDFNQKHQSAKNMWSAILFDAGFKPEMIDQMKDADFANLFETVREQQLSILGVPPALAGVFRYANYANVEQQIQIYWENTILPDLALVEEDLTQIVLPLLDASRQLVAKYDRESIPALQERQLMRADKLGSLVQKGMLSLDGAAAMLGQPKVIGGGGSTRWLPTTLQEVGFEVRPAASTRSASWRAKFIDNPVRDTKRKAASSSFAAFERPYQRDVQTFLNEQKGRVLARLGRLEKGRKAVTMDEVWSSDLENAKLRGVIFRASARVARTRGQAVVDEVNPGSAFLIDDPAIQEALESAAGEMVVGINDATRELLNEFLAEANASGLTTNEMAQGIEELFAWGPARAQRIARTETGRAYNASSYSAAKQQSEYIESQEWLTAGDEKVRDTHAAIDGEIVGLDEPFGNGCRYPGDPAAAASETINCRCTVEFIEKKSRGVRIIGDLSFLKRRNGKPARTPTAVRFMQEEVS